MANRIGNFVFIPFNIPATELGAGTPIDVVAPVGGVIHKAFAMVNEAIVTGGDIAVKIGTTDVVGLTLTVANSATKGTVITDTPTLPSATRRVEEGGRMQLVPAAAFNGGGAVNGFLVLETGKAA